MRLWLVLLLVPAALAVRRFAFGSNLKRLGERNAQRSEQKIRDINRRNAVQIQKLHEVFGPQKDSLLKRSNADVSPYFPMQSFLNHPMRDILQFQGAEKMKQVDKKSADRGKRSFAGPGIMEDIKRRNADLLNGLHVPGALSNDPEFHKRFQEKLAVLASDMHLSKDDMLPLTNLDSLKRHVRSLTHNKLAKRHDDQGEDEDKLVKRHDDQVEDEDKLLKRHDDQGEDEDKLVKRHDDHGEDEDKLVKRHGD